MTKSKSITDSKLKGKRFPKASRFQKGQTVYFMVPYGNAGEERRVNGLILEVRGNSADGFMYLLRLVTNDLVSKKESVLLLSK